MISTYGSAILIAIVAVILGRGVLSLCSHRGTPWLAAPVGFAVLMVICEAAVSLPGHGVTAVAILAVLTAAALALGVLRGGRRPSPLDAVLVAIGVIALASLPFLTAGRVGVLGVSLLNDTHWHLILTQGLLDPAIKPVDGYGAGYPLGPHAVAAVFAEGLGTRVDWTLTGMLMAIPLLTGWAALGALETISRPRRWLVAILAGIPYLAAASYIQSAFKEPIMSLLLIGLVLVLLQVRRAWRTRPQAILVPAAVLIAGVLYDYSYPGLLWPVAVIVVWAVVEIVLGNGWRHLGRLAQRLLSGWRYVVLALVVLVVLVAPTIGRIHTFYLANGGTAAGTVGGITTAGPSSLADLAAPLRALEGLDVWLWGDFRFVPPNALQAGLLAGISLAVLVLALVLVLGRSELTLGHRELAWPAALLGLGVVYLYAHHDQSPYVAAKALAIAAPLLVLFSGGMLVRRLELVDWPSWPAAALGILAVAFFSLALASSALVLKDAEVAPLAHFDQLRALRPELHGRLTLAMFYDDYAQWELLGTPERMPQQQPAVATRAARPWSYGQPYQFDSFSPATLDAFAYVITSRTLAQSQPPPNFHLVGGSADYEIWRREGPTPAFAVLPSATGQPGAVLDCRTAAGRAISRRRGFAEVRAAPRYTAVQPLIPGQSETIGLHLPSGTWQLSLPYTSQEAVRVSGAGVHVKLPANLDRPGIVWPVGTVTSTGASISLTFTMTDPGVLTTQDPSSQFLMPEPLVAVPDRPDTRVPLGSACGRYVDWYQLTS